MIKNTFLHGSFLSSNIRTEYSYYSKDEGRLFIGELVSYPKAFWQIAHHIKENVWVLLHNPKSTNLTCIEVFVWVLHTVWINYLHFQLHFWKTPQKTHLYLKNINAYHFRGIWISSFKISLPFERQIKERHLKIYLPSFHFKCALSILHSKDTPWWINSY